MSINFFRERKVLSFGVLIFSLSLVLGGCSFPWEKQRELPAIENPLDALERESNQEKTSQFTGDLRKFANENALVNFLAPTAPVGGITASWLLAENNYGMADDRAALKTISVDKAAAASPDIVKVDKGHAYILVRNEIQIVNLSVPNDANIVGKISLSSRPLELLVANGRLAVIGFDQDIKETGLYRSSKRQGNYVYLKIFDVSNPSSPRELRSLSFEGGYVGARLLGDYVYLLSANPATYSESESILPRIVEKNKVVSGDCTLGKDCYNPEIFYFDADYRHYTFLSLTATSLTDSQEPLSGQAYLLDTNFNLHLSLVGNLFLTRTDTFNIFNLEQAVKKSQVLTSLSADDQKIIKEIDDSPSFMLSDVEKALKSSAIVDRYISALSESERKKLQTEIETALVSRAKQKSAELDKTDIYKFSLQQGRADYQARGTVAGGLLSASSLDEKEDNLRLVTSRHELWSRLFEGGKRYYSSVYVLDGGLRLLGSLENIATDSRLLSADFVGSRAYISSVDKTAATYVINLADATKPAILGAVQMGDIISFYPLDDKGEKLMCLSRKVSDSGASTLKLSLFDFTDLQKPKELSGYLIGDSSSASIALQDYKALTYLPASKTVSLPAVFQADERLNFSGALVFGIDNDALALNGRIDHSAGGHFKQADYWRGFSYYDNTVKRSLVVGDNLLTVSNKYLKISTLSDLKEIKSLVLTVSADDDIIKAAPDSSLAAPDSSLAAPDSSLAAPDSSMNQVDPNENQLAPEDIGANIGDGLPVGPAFIEPEAGAETMFPPLEFP